MIQWTLGKLWEEKNAIILSGSVLFVIITWFMSLTPPFVVKEMTRKPVIVEQGGHINVCRNVEYLSDTTIKISRHLVRWDDELKRYRSKPIGSIDSTPRDSGYISICRDVTIPKDTTLGHWTMWTHVQVKRFPWWAKTFKILPLDVEVIESKGK